MNEIWKEIYDTHVRPNVTREEINELVIKLQNKEDISKIEVLRSVGLAIVSQNAETAANDYFEIVSKIAPNCKNLEKDLLAITFRPVYYMGVETLEGIKRWIEYLLKNSKNKFNDLQKKWLLSLLENEELINNALEKLFELESKYVGL